MAHLQPLVSRHPLSPEQLAQVQTRQQQAEQKATDQLTQLTQQQQRRQPALDAQQAAAQQQADAKAVTVLTVKTYREVFLPNQLFAVLQSLTLTSQAQQDWQALNHELLSSVWWKQQAAQAPASVAAHSATLVKLTTDLLGFDPATAPAAPAPLATAPLRELLASDRFDRFAAAQLLAAAAQADKRVAGAGLAQAVQEFHALATSLAASQPLTPAQAKQQRNQVKKSLHHVNQELARYQTHVGDTGSLKEARKSLLTATADYLAKNGGKS
ncbi:MAG: hypothetical protein ACRYFX_22080 [Janthinobacterium lividum]